LFNLSVAVEEAKTLLEFSAILLALSQSCAKVKINPLSPDSDQHQISPHHISVL